MFQAGQQIGLYTLVKKLDKGGFGEVWLAEKQSEFVTKKVAIKLPLDEQVDFDAIRQEATLWEQASGHPNVLPLIDADVYDGQVAIVSEYAEDGSLADRLKTQGKLSVREAVEMTVGILNGLNFLHSKNIIHRDIKPANILLQGDTPRLADFGISRAIHASEISSVIVGTESYMAPESFEGVRSVQTDIWAVGVLLYKLLTGNLPFPQKQPTEAMYAVLQKEPEPLPDEIPPQLKKIVFKALEKDIELEENPPQRYQTAAAMREELKSFLETASQPVLMPEKAVSQLSDYEKETIVRLKIPIATKSTRWRNLGQNFTRKTFSSAVIFSMILGFAAIAGLSVYLFNQTSTDVSNVSNTMEVKLNNPVSNLNAANNSQTVLEYFQQGNKYYNQRNFDRAIAAYTKAIELNPSDFTFYNNRGLAFYRKRLYDEAIADFDKAIDLSPDAGVYNNRGVAYEDKGDTAQAIADYRKALELDPNYKTANNNLNKILR